MTPNSSVNVSYVDLVKQIATEQGVDPALGCAVAEHESSWNPWAVRYEPAFYMRYIEEMRLPPTEAQGRAFSYGLMQIMGQTARELGFAGKYLSELFDPEQGILYGMKKLSLCVNKTSTVRDALLRYNGGGNSDYPDMVIPLISKFE